MTILAERLNQWNSDTIKKYVTLLGGRSNITRKADRVNFVCAKLLDKTTLRTIWRQLDSVAQRAVSTAYHNNGEFDSNVFVAQYGELHGGNYWNVVNGLYINAVIWEYLGTIGAVDVAYADDRYASFLDAAYDYSDEPVSLYDGLLYFRINRWGAFLLGQADVFVPTQPKQKALFTISEDKRLHLLAELLPNERLQLEVMAEQIDPQTYQLDQVKLLTAVEGGQQLDQLITFLQANHQGELLAYVSEWLSRLQQNQEVFREVETAVLIQLNQPGLMTLTQQDKALTKLCQKVDDKTILVQSSRLARFRRRLKELGYLLT